MGQTTVPKNDMEGKEPTRRIYNNKSNTIELYSQKRDER